MTTVGATQEDVPPTKVGIAIVGAGFSGIGLGIKLKQTGMNDFVILERSNAVGGVWEHNRYPGAACDVPSHLYSYSFEPWAEWPDKYASQASIAGYLRNCTHKYGLDSHIRLGSEIAEARWDEEFHHWVLRSSAGRVFEARALVTATGLLSRPATPRLPGLACFGGAVFHSAEWREDFDLGGKCVGVIGTGASAIQFVPAIAASANKLYVFQRSAAYVLPKADRAYPKWQRFLFKHVPGLLKLNRMLIYIGHELMALGIVTIRPLLKLGRAISARHIRRKVNKPQLRQLLTPDYDFGCKRVLLSNEYYPAMDLPNVELVTQRITEVRTNAIVTADSAERKIDCIIFGTGFAAGDFLAPMQIIGREGQDLRQAWKGGAEAYLGMTVAGFPNFFMLYGPNTNLAHNSIVYMIESQIRYIVACLGRLCSGKVRAIEVKRSIQDRYNANIQERLQQSIWSTGCASWYLTPGGKNTTNWPSYSFGYRLRTRAPKWDDYAVQ